MRRSRSRSKFYTGQRKQMFNLFTTTFTTIPLIKEGFGKLNLATRG